MSEYLLPTTYKVWGKVMFLQVSVILSVIGGGIGVWSKGGECLVWRGV